MQFFIFFINFVLFSLSLPEYAAHKFYVSTTEVELKREKKTVQVTTQLFIDDLEFLLQQSDSSIRLDPETNKELIDSLLEKELKDKLQFSTKNKIFEYTFLGKEYRNDIALCYLEFQFENIPKTLKIKNTFFFNIFEGQQNIIHFKSEGIRKSFLLHSNKPDVIFELNILK
jgi:hypothetical protein